MALGVINHQHAKFRASGPSTANGSRELDNDSFMALFNGAYKKRYLLKRGREDLFE